MILEFFFIIFPKKWVGRVMGNETFYGDGLSVGSPSEFGSDEIWWITPSYQWHRHGQSGFVSRNFRESPGQICIICHKQTSFQFFLNKMFVCEDGSSFYFLKRRNSLNFRSFCVLEYWRNDSFPNKDFAEIVLTILRQIM